MMTELIAPVLKYLWINDRVNLDLTFFLEGLKAGPLLKNAIQNLKKPYSPVVGLLIC